jgi:hypothetical protein
MTNSIKINEPTLINIKESQQHPFHILTSSKLPILTSILAGSLALTFIAKLHNIDYSGIKELSFVVAQVLDPLFSLGSLHYISTNVTILYFLAFLFAVM